VVSCMTGSNTVITLHPDRYVVRIGNVKRDVVLEELHAIQLMQKMTQIIRDAATFDTCRQFSANGVCAWTTEDKQNMPTVIKNRIQLLMKMRLNITNGGNWSVGTRSTKFTVEVRRQISLNIYHNNTLCFTFYPRERLLRCYGVGENPEPVKVDNVQDTKAMDELCEWVDLRYCSEISCIAPVKCLVKDD
jgi:hypothetical protein